MASQSDIDRLDEAIFSPYESVQDGQRRVQQRPMRELIEARERAAAASAEAGGKKRVRRLAVTLAEDI